MLTRILIMALVACSVAAGAAGPTETPPASPTTPTRLSPGAGFPGTSETTISGLVADKNGKPLADVSVKLYVGGLLIAEQTTSIDGSFEFLELIDYGRDVTIDVWFVPPEGSGLVMEDVILRESSAAIAHELYSRCVKRVPLEPITDFVVKLLDLKTRNRMLENSDCVG